MEKAGDIMDWQEKEWDGWAYSESFSHMKKSRRERKTFLPTGWSLKKEPGTILDFV